MVSLALLRVCCSSTAIARPRLGSAASSVLFNHVRNIQRYSDPNIIFPPDYVPPEKDKSLEDILAEQDAKDPDLNYRVNIGFEAPPRRRNKEVLAERIKIRKEMRKDEDVQKATRAKTHRIPLDQVYENWTTTVGPLQIRDAAEYYGIYETLFENAYFMPHVPLSILYEYPNKPDTVSRVYMGNMLKPTEASTKPEVTYPVKDDKELYTLQLTGPDCHISSDEKGEYFHWLVGNIPGNDLSKGQELINYMQPIPPRGLGFCRYVFILYKQDKKIDFSKYERKSPCNNLAARSITTYDFYREFQDHMTPIGLSFFQSDWDVNLVDFYQNVLEMPEPSFEYDFPEIEKPPQEKYPQLKAFNLYLDQYKDWKTLQRELLIEKLKEVHPFEKPPKPFKYPLAQHFPKGLSSWEQEDLRKKRMREGKYKYM